MPTMRRPRSATWRRRWPRRGGRTRCRATWRRCRWGTSSRQFVKLATGDWLSTGGGYAKLSQTGTRVPYEYKCTYAPPPYAMARGWNIAGVSFDVADAGGNVQHFDNWTNTYTTQGAHACAQMRGFRLSTWTFANGVKDTAGLWRQDRSGGAERAVPGSGIESLTSVTNSLGRTIVFDVPGHLFDNGLTGADSRFVTMTTTGGGLSPETASFTDPLGKVTMVSLNGWVTGSLTQNPIQYQTPYQIFYPDHPSLPAIQYDTDTLGRIAAVHDAINLQVGDHTVAGGRDPTQFFNRRRHARRARRSAGRGVCGVLRPVGPSQPLHRRARP